MFSSRSCCSSCSSPELADKARIVEAEQAEEAEEARGTTAKEESRQGMGSITKSSGGRSQHANDH